MEKFAGYGFNKSHAAAYSLLAYHTAWIKVHCTAEFYAANMTVESDNTDKLKVLHADAKLFGISFEPPDVNRGVLPLRAGVDKLVRYGLGAVKGTGQGAIEAIVAAREGQGAPGRRRRALPQPVRLLRPRGPQGRQQARGGSAVKAGAFDLLHADRAALLASVGLAFEWADTMQANALQVGLFDSGDAGDTHGSSTQEPALVHVAPWDVREKLVQEKAALGFYFSGHLFDAWAPKCGALCASRWPTWWTAANCRCWPAS
jgi:DNA polymerase-3 subunit alpha